MFDRKVIWIVSTVPQCSERTFHSFFFFSSPLHKNERALSLTGLISDGSLPHLMYLDRKHSKTWTTAVLLVRSIVPTVRAPTH